MAAKSLRESAMDYLARREHSELELIQKLTRKGFELHEVHEVVAQLKNDNLQSDTRFTESFIRSRVESGHGPIRIQIELQQRGVADEIIATCLPAEQDFWWDVMEREWRKKFQGKTASDHKTLAKQSRFLMQRGFGVESIRELISE